VAPAHGFLLPAVLARSVWLDRYEGLFAVFLCAAIWILLDLAWLLMGAVLAHDLVSGHYTPWADWEATLVYVGGAMLLLGFVLFGIYTSGRSRRPLILSAYMVVIVLLAEILIDRLILRSQSDYVATLMWLDTWLLLSLAMMAAGRFVLMRWVRRLGGRGGDGRRVVMAGQAKHLVQRASPESQRAGDYRVVAAIDLDGGPDEPDALCDVDVLPDLDALLDMARHHRFDELWLALPMSNQQAIQRYVMSLQHYFVDIRLLSDAQDLPLFNPSATTLGGASFIDLVTSPRSDDNSWTKPLFDRAFAFAILVLLSPVLLFLALAVKVSSPGPVFFRQRRKGMDGREFTILKYRSMRVHAEEAGKLTQAGKNDTRVTAVGRLLRKTSLDELPQFINVLLGQMSVVGPRPHAPEHDDFYMRLIDGYMYRYRIRPGITGWAQVNGFRGETAKVESMAGRVALDLFYIQHWSFWLDLKIVAMTVVKGFVGKNAY